MTRNPFAFAALLALLAAAPAGAVTLCAAGNPNNTSVAESTPTSAFVNNNDGTITHNLTGLMWKRCVQGASGASCAGGSATPMAWTDALLSTVADTTAGYGDWRLPNMKELESVVETCGSAPAINQVMFPATPVDHFWSSTSEAVHPDAAWQVSFDQGEMAPDDKTANYYVRLVRGGQSVGVFDAQIKSTLDIDGNGTADALTDGLLIVRYLMGLRNNSLINGVVDPLGKRTTADAIQAYILTLLP